MPSIYLHAFPRSAPSSFPTRSCQLEFCAYDSLSHSFLLSRFYAMFISKQYISLLYLIWKIIKKGIRLQVVFWELLFVFGIVLCHLDYSIVLHVVADNCFYRSVCMHMRTRVCVVFSKLFILLSGRLNGFHFLGTQLGYWG